MAKGNPKPTEKTNWIPDDTTNIVPPSAGRKLVGWLFNIKPPAEIFNWFWNLKSRFEDYFAGQVEDWIVIDSDADEGDYATLTAYLADAPAAGDRVLVKEDQTVTVQTIIPSDITLKLLDGSRLLCATNIATSVTQWGSGIIIEGVLNIILSQTGVTAKAVELNGDNVTGKINVENSSTGTLTTGYHINAGKKGNNFSGYIQNTGAGSITNKILDNSTNELNYLRITDVDSDIIQRSEGALRIGNIKADNTIEIAITNVLDYAGNMNSKTTRLFPWSIPVDIGPSGTLPGSSVSGSAWSPNGEFLALAISLSPFIFIYQRTSKSFIKLTNPGTLPTGNGESVAWSPNSEFLVVGHAVSPRISIYQRQGNIFTKVANPAALPASTGSGVDFSPNCEYFAVAHPGSPFVTTYRWTGPGSIVFTKLADPGTLPAGTGNDVAWSPNGEFLVVAHDTTPFITIYQYDGSTFTKLANPASLPASNANGAAWSPCGRYLAIAHDTTPFMTVYERTGIVFTRLTDPATIPTGVGQKVKWSPDGRYLAVAHFTSPFISIYKLEDGILTKQTDPASIPDGQALSVDWSPDNQFLTIGFAGTDDIIIYQTSSILPDDGVVKILGFPREGD